MDDLSLNEHLQPLSFLVGSTWSGEFATSTPDKPVRDVMRWERALNGNGIKVRHSVNEGEYGGETMIIWDASGEAIIYYYFTTSGFFSRGTLVPGENHYTAHEEITGNSNGITAVKAQTHLTPNGTLRVTSQYFRGGDWVEGHEITYTKDPKAVVVFQ